MGKILKGGYALTAAKRMAEKMKNNQRQLEGKLGRPKLADEGEETA